MLGCRAGGALNRATWMPEVDVEADVQPAPLRAEWERVSLEACARYGVTGSGLRDSNGTSDDGLVLAVVDAARQEADRVVAQ